MANAPKMDRCKALYVAPALVEYGSVRNLTGGSQGTHNDSQTTRAQPRNNT